METILEPLFTSDKPLIPEFERMPKLKLFLFFLHNIYNQQFMAQKGSHIINNRTKMNNEPHRIRQQFLDKFEGRKNVIGKEGLIHILEQQRSSHDHRHQLTSHRSPKHLNPILQKDRIQENVPSTQPHSQKDSNKRNSRNLQKMSKHSQQVGRVGEGRYKLNDPLNDFKSQQFTSKVKLPSINKSSSLSSHHRKHHTDIINAQITGTTGVSGSNKLKILPRKMQTHQSVVLNNMTKKMELDSYAMRHLQFMDKFQRQLLQNQAVSKRTARSEMHRHV